MITISSGEFRANQKEGTNKVSPNVSPNNTTANDALISKEDFFKQIEEAIADVKAGKTYKMRADETLDKFMKRMEQEGLV